MPTILALNDKGLIKGGLRDLADMLRIKNCTSLVCECCALALQILCEERGARVPHCHHGNLKKKKQGWYN